MDTELIEYIRKVQLLKDLMINHNIREVVVDDAYGPINPNMLTMAIKLATSAIGTDKITVGGGRPAWYTQTFLQKLNRAYNEVQSIISQ